MGPARAQIRGRINSAGPFVHSVCSASSAMFQLLRLSVMLWRSGLYQVWITVQN